MKKFIAFLAVLLMASVSSAATATFNGQTITYTGASVSTVNNQLVLKFTGSGTLTLPSQATARILAVGGGGAGGRVGDIWGSAGGGGGAGEMVDRSGVTLSSGSYTITVGVGGAAPTSGMVKGGTGGESAVVRGDVDVLRVKGGGGGGTNASGSRSGNAGGSGGGGCGRNDSGTPNGGGANKNETDGFVNAGGAGNQYCAAGGGGAGGTGVASTSSTGGAGGPGKTSDIAGSSVTYAAGGGGGAGYSASYSQGAGGSNGVGGEGGRCGSSSSSGNSPTNAKAGTANTGSGGGGGARRGDAKSYSGFTSAEPGAGGSGIVVIRLTSITSDPVCRIGATTYTTLEAAIEAATNGQTIQLLKNITISSDVTVNKNVTITSTSGNNFKITRNANCALYVTANVTMTNVTVDGGQNWNNSTISTTTNGTNAPRGKSLIFVERGAQLTLNSGATVQNLWGRKMNADDSDEYAGIHNAGTLVINDGAVLQGLRHRASAESYYAQQKGGAIYSTGTVTMNGGTIQNCYSVGLGGAIYAAAGTVELKGGTITNCAAAEGGGAVYLAPGRSYTFFRFAITKVQGNNGMQLSELSLKDANGNRVNQGTYTESTGDWSTLGVRQYKVTQVGGYGTGETPNNLFDGNTGTKMYESAAAFTFGFRIPDGSATVAGYTFTTANDSTPTRNPLSWTVEGSTDGQNWVVLDQRSSVNNMPQTNFTESPLYSLQTPAVAASAVLSVSGDATVTNNHKIADGQSSGTLNNVQPTAADQIEIAGAFAGSVGVSYPATAPENAQFGVFSSGSGAEKFAFDADDALIGSVVGSTLVWAEKSPWLDPAYDIPTPDVRLVDPADLGATGAEVSLVGTDVVLVFRNPSAGGSFTVPNFTHARVLVVGGGGAGGTVGVLTPQGAAGGGGAGGMSEVWTTLEPGDYRVRIGRGASQAESYAQSWVGRDGEMSALETEDGTYVTSAKGGGGGGAPTARGEGVDGGSGGGGSWYGKFLKGGGYTDGFGWYGATPVNPNVGGGGGGASQVIETTDLGRVVHGAGKSDGTGGEGRASDITGASVMYAVGGRGGDRTDANYVPQAGVAPGSGGDGAGARGAGAAGADGIVVVRLIDYFDVVKVPIPPYTDVFTWENGETFAALDLAGAPSSYQNAIAAVEGTTQVVCSVTTDAGHVVTNGLGRYAFTLTLNPGYVWDDGTDEGYDGAETFFWRVREDNVVGSPIAEVTKTVDWFDTTNATIAITAHTTPERRKITPRVLFLGSLCSAHDFSPSILKAALDAITDVGDVDYYLFNNVTNKTSAAPAYSGSLAQGTKFDVDSVSMLSSNHSSLYGFYDTLASLINRGEQYEYVVFSFDRTLTAAYFPGAHANERAVVDFLKPLYDRNAVVWLVDNQSAGPTSPSISQTPWYPNQLVYLHFIASRNAPPDRWTSLYEWEYSWGNFGKNNEGRSKSYSWAGLKALMGLFDPDKYYTMNNAARTDYINNTFIADTEGITAAKVAATAGRVNPNQVVYDDANNVARLLHSIIKPIEYSVVLKDNIHIDTGLKLNAVYGQWTTNEATMGWVDLVSTPGATQNLFPSESGVHVDIADVTSDVWIKLWIEVSDTGPFLSSVGATYNTRTGLWQKDPNNGPVSVESTQEDGTKILAEDKASTEVEWPFSAFVLTGEVMTGPQSGDIVVNGFATNWVAVLKDSFPKVVFRGAPGYVLERLQVDGEEVEFDLLTSEWLFEHINSDHDVKVWYKPYAVSEDPPPDTEPVVVPYDGTPYAPTVTSVTFTEDIPYPWYPVYSFDPDAPDSEWSSEIGQTNVVYDENGNVTSTNIYVRIAVAQPGYEEPVILDNWTGEDTVTILPREITVTFDDQFQTNSTKITDFTWKLTDGELVEGDTLIGSGVCTNYPATGIIGKGVITGSAETPIKDASTGKSSTVFNVETPDCETCNYIVNVVPGDYYNINGNYYWVESEGVEKVYDGEPESIAVTPHFGHTDWKFELKQIEYSMDGTSGWTTVKPTFTDVGTHEVFYRVQYYYGDNTAYSDVASDHVIIHPRTVTVTAGSATKFYDGQPLTEDSFTVAEPTATTGFVEGEGLADVTMTGGSTRTAIGSTANVIDPNAMTPLDGTNLSNYDITYVDGTLEVLGRIETTPSSVEKYYDGTPSGIGVETDIPEGVPYTIRYSTDPKDPDSWTTDNPTYTDVGVGHVVTYIVEAEGYAPVTNEAYVTIWPREIVLTADDKEKIYGTPDPELTWSLGPNPNVPEGVATGVVPGEEDAVRALVGGDDSFSIVRTGTGTADGEKVTPANTPGYPITPSGSEYIGNYHVVYEPGELRIVPAIFSSNIYGLLKINSTFANTIIPAPWKGYTRQGTPDLDIRVDRLVKPRNLTEGDRLLYMAGDGTYKTWVLEIDKTTREGRWSGITTASMAGASPEPDDVVRSLVVKPAGDETLKRGYGIWLIRANPVSVTNGGATTNAIPFYLHGQWMTGVEEIEVFGTDSSTQGIKYEGAEYDKAAYTMLADPDCTRPSVVNSHTWTDWGGDDTLIVNTDELTTYFCLHLPKRGGGYQDGWRYWAGTGYKTDAQTSSGIGFWYVRRTSGNLNLKWDGPARYEGEAQPHAVWIVDHADAGDGKVHLAFKLESPIAPSKMTTTFIQELFDSRSIRYMHTTGATQAAGKEAMDALDPEKASDVKLVPALRNGTGVATSDPATDPDLAKGWIWVTVDVPDGTNPFDSSKDGTGDTNGAGDLWRIVIGRGMWENE